MAEASVINEVITTRDGKSVERKYGPRQVPPGIDLMDPRGIAGSVAASEVLQKGGSIQDALDAAIKARQQAPDVPVQSDASVSPGVEEMIRYVHAIARLHSGRFEELTPIGMLEVAMLCPYPVCSLEEWKEKLKIVMGR